MQKILIKTISRMEVAWIKIGYVSLTKPQINRGYLKTPCWAN